MDLRVTTWFGENFAHFSFVCVRYGKTTTLCELIHQFVAINKYKVLVVAPSNVAVDNLVEKLVAVKGRKWKLCRVGHPARMLSTIHKHSLDSLVQESENTKLAQDIRGDIAKLLKELSKEGTDDGRKLKH